MKLPITKGLGQKGAAFPIVLFFSIFAFVSVSGYVLIQGHLNRPLLMQPRRLQSLLNARSGIWVALNLLGHTEQEQNSFGTDSVETIFGADLFSSLSGGTEEESSDTTMDAGDSLAILESGMPLTITPYRDTGLGAAEISLVVGDFTRTIQSIGAYTGLTDTVRAKVGSRPFVYPDTVLFLDVVGAPQGYGYYEGDFLSIPAAIDSGNTGGRTRFGVDDESLENYIQNNSALLTPLLDQGIQEQPLTIQSDDELEEIGAEVNGHLFLDGRSQDITWNEERTVHVMGDLQVTGTVHMENLRILVGGEIRILDEASFESVDLYAENRIFFGEEMTTNEIRFQGSAATKGVVEIVGETQILDHSTIISLGKQQKADSSKTDLGESPPPPEKEKSEEGAEKTDAGGEKYGIYVRNTTEVDGVLISLGPNLGIRTDPETFCSGILWAEGKVCHQGELQGVIRANVLTTVEDPGNTAANHMSGTVRTLETISSYTMPYFIGLLTVLEWRES